MLLKCVNHVLQLSGGNAKGSNDAQSVSESCFEFRSFDDLLKA